MKINMSDLMKCDDLQQQVEHEEEGKLKSEHLRAGNAGILLDDGNCAGACPRQAFLRLKGISVPSDEDRAVMFEFGRENETIIINKLKRQLGNSMVVTGDDINSIEWKLPNGRVVSGRPDVVVSTKDGTPVLMLELKLLCSMWTSKSVVFGGEAKLGHLIQAAHYMTHMKCPCKLIYVQAVDFHVSDWSMAFKGLPKPGENRSELIEYSEKLDKKTNTKYMAPKKMLPSRTVFDVSFGEDGFVQFRREDSKNGFTKTPINSESIVKYYELIDRMEAEGLGNRVLALKSTGDFEGYSACDYCELKPACDKYEKHLDKWLVECASIATTKASKL